MPASEPLPGAPEFIQAGAVDMQVFFDRIGMGWLLPWMPAPIPRLVTVSELCALPQPAAEPFTLLDVVSMQTGDDAALAARQKLANWVDSDLWNTNCRYSDDTPTTPPPPQAPLPDLPPIVPPPGSDRLIRDMWTWLEWMRKQVLTRTYVPFGSFTISGSGEHFIDTFDGGDWMVQAAGVLLTVTEKPDFAGQSHSGSPAVYFDLGYVSLSNFGEMQAPIRIQRTTQIIWASVLQVMGIAYNLLPGVTIEVIPLYPGTTRVLE